MIVVSSVFLSVIMRDKERKKYLQLRADHFHCERYHVNGKERQIDNKQTERERERFHGKEESVFGLPEYVA